MSDQGSRRRVISFGTYSKRPEYPRQRNLIEALQRCGVEVLECHEPMESTFQERFRSSATPLGPVRFGLRLVRSYARLIRRFRSMPVADTILVGYPALFHVWLARRLAARRAKATTIVADIFAPIYETVVVDRKLKKPGSPLARILLAVEKRAYGAADVCLIDTDAHGDYVARLFDLPRNKVVTVFVGPMFTPYPAPPTAEADPSPFTVLFVGTFIPLQGVDTIIGAAKLLTEQSDIRFLLVGEGQTRAQAEALVQRWGLANVEFRNGVAAEKLGELIRSASVSLGIFGTTAKSARVIPHKVFDACAAGVPIVTADTSAARELLVDRRNALLVPAGDSRSLANALKELKQNAALRAELGQAALELAKTRFEPPGVIFRCPESLASRASEGTR